MTLIVLTPPRTFAAAGRSELVLSRDAVVDVLRRYASGELHSRAVQRWGFFVRHGWLAGTKGISPRLNIYWEAGYEDSIVAALNWLAELGDGADPTPREDEIATLVPPRAIEATAKDGPTRIARPSPSSMLEVLTR